MPESKRSPAVARAFAPKFRVCFPYAAHHLTRCQPLRKWHRLKHHEVNISSTIEDILPNSGIPPASQVYMLEHMEGDSDVNTAILAQPRADSASEDRPSELPTSSPVVQQHDLGGTQRPRRRTAPTLDRNGIGCVWAGTIHSRVHGGAGLVGLPQLPRTPIL
ncbi:hypothetical protein DICSQDRAFT_152727 [Dichomitus squalens LYAD-421 SS1]|uniref:uncharacterized protein n=1 Tax=Dichomitus squalens (strain LYAD-421) TaxID=732165 RepID=UPI000441569A|nr:uncharacterized protein DICSQDRAFT_152727 [Dichomitus squalens LYAD-421 SS1]EJF65573.1 hypothetical protein DICSQDRAFT_152727 [Dichomitus squalens LYAD-421 SS1]